MLRVGILTIHNSPNYGASLQSYALYKYISQQSGIECEIIDLHRPHEDGYVKVRNLCLIVGNLFL